MQLYKQALNAHIYSDMSLLRQFLLLATTLTATQSLTCTSGNTFKLKGQTLTTPPRQANVSCGALITFVENEYHEIHSRSGGDEPDVMQNMSEQLTVAQVLRQLAFEGLSPVVVLMFS